MFRRSLSVALIIGAAASASSAEAQTKYYSRAKLTPSTTSAATTPPVTPPASGTLTCSTPVQHYWNDNGSANNLLNTTTASPQAAMEWCNAQLASRTNLRAASCLWTSSSNATYLQTNSNIVRRTDSISNVFWAVACS